MTTNEKVLERVNNLSIHKPILEDTLNIPDDISMQIEEILNISSIKVNQKTTYKVIKRIADIVLSLVAILLLSPLMICISLAIYIEDKGSPIFSQIRFTEGGKTFKMYKFRSMCINAEEKISQLSQFNEVKGGVIFKLKDDPRVTKIGKFIRQTSIDELPQLFNILSGDMSIVGPRPPIAREVVQYTPYQANRLLVKGGLTCFWQCSGRSDLGFEDQVNLDIKYIQNRSTLLDIKLVVKTIKTVLKMDGAQ